MLMFWILAGALCVATVAALALQMNAAATPAADRNDAVLAIYKDQLLELDRDVTAGTIAASEAQAQRTEISRRLLAVAHEQKQAGANPHSAGLRQKAMLAPLLVPLIAVAVYGLVGNYGLQDVPRAERLARADTSNDWEALVARVEQHLEQDPNDLQGWQLLVPNYLNMGRYGDAATAMGRIADLSGPTPDLYAGMAEALVFQNKGLMTAQAERLVQEALKLDARHPKALYYDALGTAQDGRPAEARTKFEALLKMAPVDAPWKQAVQGELARLDPNAAAPVLSAEQMQGAAGMNANDRMAMVRGMVDGLDVKLKANPKDLEGWLRLIRARMVLKDDDKAVAALAEARTTFAGDEPALGAINALATELKMK